MATAGTNHSNHPGAEREVFTAPRSSPPGSNRVQPGCDTVAPANPLI
jgi:hypothetical protein